MAGERKSKTDSLEDRFLSFLSSLDGAESIDDDVAEIDLEYRERADFLLNGRKIVLEVKSLKDDPEYKVEERLEKHRIREEFPLFYGTRDLKDVLKHLPGGDQINQEVFHALTRSIQGGVEKADRQIASTKESLGLPDACGVVAILNEEIGILSPNVIAFAVQRVLSKKKDGDLRYRNISYALILNESHVTRVDDQTDAFSIILLEGPCCSNDPAAEKYLDELPGKWSESQAAPLLSMSDPKKFPELHFEQTNSAVLNENVGTIRRQDLWRRNYHENRYLESLSDDAYFQHLAMIFDSYAPHMLVGADKLPEQKVREFLEGWTHALEEGNLRGVDMRHLYLHSEFMKNQSSEERGE